MIFACNANQTLMILDKSYVSGALYPLFDTLRERISQPYRRAFGLLSPSGKRSEDLSQRGATILNNTVIGQTIMKLLTSCISQQPWVKRSDKPCLVTYNPISEIDWQKIIGRWWFQHIVHDVRHIAWLIHLFRFIQGKRRTWHCGAHTLVNSQETCLVTGLAAAKQIGADYPFEDPVAK